MLLNETQQTTVFRILRRYLPQHRVMAFGSRVKGNPKPYSDLDLAILDGPLPLSLMATLAHAFEESDLPFKVDLLDFAAADPTFQNLITAQGENLPFPGKT